MKIFPNSWFHWQNLNERIDGSNGLPIHGRCWYNLNLKNELYFCWNLKSDFCHIGLQVGGYDQNILFKVAFPPIALWFGFNTDKIRNFYYARDISLSIHSGSIWWNFWTKNGYWDNKVPKWRDGNFNVLDFLFGKENYNSELIEEKEIDIPMPEGNYKAKIKMSYDSWDRKRGMKKIIKRAHIEMIDPIPFPGKGENSWDCGDDATRGATMPANSIADAVGKMVSSVLSNRMRRGIYKWTK